VYVVCRSMSVSCQWLDVCTLCVGLWASHVNDWMWCSCCRCYEKRWSSTGCQTARQRHVALSSVTQHGN